MSARPSPVVSARNRGCRSTRQPCWVPNSRRRTAPGRTNHPPGRPTGTPRHHRNRRCQPGHHRSCQPGTAGGSRPANRLRCKRNRPPRTRPDRTSHPLAPRDRYTPASPKPTMSARPSPVVSARNRGWWSTRQPRRRSRSCRRRTGPARTSRWCGRSTARRRRRRSRRCQPGRRPWCRPGSGGAGRPASPAASRSSPARRSPSRSGTGCPGWRRRRASSSSRGTRRRGLLEVRERVGRVAAEVAVDAGERRAPAPTMALIP